MTKDQNNRNFLEYLLDDKEFKDGILKSSDLSDKTIRGYKTSYPEYSREIELAAHILRSQKFNIEDEVNEDYDAIWGKLQNEIVSDKSDNWDASGKRVNWWYAAAAVITIVISVWVFKEEIASFQENQADVEQIVKHNPKGRKSTITLVDGTKVILNSESTLTYLTRFSEKERKVELVGEAFFEVTRDEKRPFIVTTGAVNTTVLGTSFNIRHFPDEENSYISVATGKVKVSMSDGTNRIEEILVPGEQIISSKDNKYFKKQSYSYKNVFLWKEKVLFFDHAEWEEIQTRLERWYGVDIVYENLKGSVDYSGQFDDQNLENVLLSIGYSLDFTFKKTDAERYEISFNDK